MPDLADDIATERAALVKTLRAVGPDAPTLAEGWQAATIAQHVAAQDRLRGVPALIARDFAARTGLRLSEPYLRSRRLAAVVNGRPRSWEWALAKLDRPPPQAVVRPSVAPITLWEHFVHHEDLRRPNDVERVVTPDLSVVIPWLLRYNRSRLDGVSLTLASHDGGEWRMGAGPELVVEGALGEIVLWLSGRQGSVHVNTIGGGFATKVVHNRLRI